jgi:poly [ADP-ribose] polymerase
MCRRLLWHGTNVAVVAAILKTGLRIMPHSGGRVGAGIYMANELAKSACYTRPARKGNRSVGLVFLVEAAMGKSHLISRDDSSLKQAPEGFDSVIAMGRQHPDPSMDTVITIDGQPVTVPVGKPVTNSEHAASSFTQDEYLVYKESQQRLRYICAFTY